MIVRFPTTRFEPDEWRLRIHASGMSREPGRGGYGWFLDDSSRAIVESTEFQGLTRVTRVQFKSDLGRSHIWTEQSHDTPTPSWLGESIARRLSVLLTPHLPPLGAQVQAGDLTGHVFWRGAAEGAPGYLLGFVSEGERHEARLEDLSVLNTERALDLEVAAFAPEQPVHVGSDDAAIERVERGRSGEVRLRVAVNGRAFWCDAAAVSAVKGWTLAHSAALRDDPRLCAAASDADVGGSLRAAASCRGPVSVGVTPLHLAARFQATAAFDALIRRGADVDAVDATGRSVREWMVQYNVGLASIGTENQAQMATQALAGGHHRALVALIEGGFDIDAPLPSGLSVRETLHSKEYAFQLKMTPDDVRRIEKMAAAEECPHSIQLSRSSKTKCRACGKKIQKNTEQFGLGEVSQWKTMKYQWFHLECGQTRYPDEVAAAQQAR